ncbi:MAG: hypothetical protein ACJAXJ_001222 [Colwellia sp.]|jgi:hypothetical protein
MKIKSLILSATALACALVNLLANSKQTALSSKTKKVLKPVCRVNIGLPPCICQSCVQCHPVKSDRSMLLPLISHEILTLKSNYSNPMINMSSLNNVRLVFFGRSQSYPVNALVAQKQSWCLAGDREYEHYYWPTTSSWLQCVIQCKAFLFNSATF